MRARDFKVGTVIHVADKMQRGYTYTLTAPYGFRGFPDDFRPHYTPRQMLLLGIFEGKYLNDCTGEFPEEWYTEAARRGKVGLAQADPTVNAFGIKSRLSLQEWRHRGWIPIARGDMDVRGWFQWYCRYYIGRRDPRVDDIQIRRWKSFKRHLGQIKKNCAPGDVTCRRRQRQGLLQWAYDPFV